MPYSLSPALIFEGHRDTYVLDQSLRFCGFSTATKGPCAPCCPTRPDILTNVHHANIQRASIAVALFLPILTHYYPLLSATHCSTNSGCVRIIYGRSSENHALRHRSTCLVENLK